MRTASIGAVVLAEVIIVLGVLGLARGDFMPVWAPMAKDLPARDVLVYACAGGSLAAGVGLFVRRTAALAARVLVLQLVLWIVAFRVRTIVRLPGTFGAWDGCAETIVMLAGAWVLHVWLADDWDRRRLGFSTDARGLRIARSLYGLAMIPFGIAHLLYLKETASLVPSYLPAHTAIAFATGVAFLAAGAAILTGVLAPLAAALSAVEIGAFTLLVWIPVIARGDAGAYDWSEFAVSVALTAAASVVAESYRTTSSIQS